jgi:ferritin-like metal-binding protein YciE
MASNDTTQAIQSYVTDMLALEKHISKAFQAQIEDLEDYPTVVTQLRTLHATTESHIRALEQAAEGLGGEGPTGMIKKLGSALTGLAAGAIDLVRNESLPKNLRDDYTATSLAAIGYVMLHTTALSLGNKPIADLAQRHLVDYAEAVMRRKARPSSRGPNSTSPGFPPPYLTAFERRYVTTCPMRSRSQLPRTGSPRISMGEPLCVASSSM